MKWQREMCLCTYMPFKNKSTYKACDVNKRIIFAYNSLSHWLVLNYSLIGKICSETTLALKLCIFVLCVLIPQCLGYESMDKLLKLWLSIFSLRKLRAWMEVWEESTLWRGLSRWDTPFPFLFVPTSIYFVVSFPLHSIYPPYYIVEAAFVVMYLESLCLTFVQTCLPLLHPLPFRF